MRSPSKTDRVLTSSYACRRRAQDRDPATQATAVKSLLLVLFCALAHSPTTAHADEIETEHLFGFTTGSDVGTVGEREFEGSTTARLGKSSGRYSSGVQTLSAEFVPLQNLRTEFTAMAISHDIAGVSGMDDRRQVAIAGMSADFRYRLLDRAAAPFGFAIGVEPHWTRIEETSGAPALQYGADFVVAFDKEIVPNRVVAAFNLLYQPEISRAKTTGEWSRESTSGVAAAVMAQIRPGIFVGAEARYLRHYDGFGFEAFAGNAGFLGPTLFMKLSPRAWIAAAWSAQIAGRATTAPGSLDLVNFERHQVRFLFGLNF